MRRALLGLGLLFPLLAACAHGREYAVPFEPVGDDGVVSVWVHHLEDDGESFDVKLNMRNESKGWLIVRTDDIRMFRGETQCRVEHANFGIGERVIDIAPGATKTASLVAHVPGHARGPYRVLVSRVYDNPTADGTALGDIVTKDIEWKFEEPQ